MSRITNELAALLGTVRRPGDFCAAGSVDLFAPLVAVAGVGPIALPLLPVQAAQLVRIAEQAPYGRGEETVVDTAVRRTWQIGAERVNIRDDQGSFFVGHRDTEQAPGMFATLVIVLPSLYAGGQLVVRLRGREVQLDLHGEEPSEVRFAAFYADCVHEGRPVTEGCRLTLIYNLVRRGKGRPPKPPDYEVEQGRAAALLADWAGDPTAGPDKLIYPLEHAYTQAELGFDTLKGADAAVAAVLTGAARQAGCDLDLALVSIEESGSAEPCGDYRRRRYDSGADDDDFEVGEVYEPLAPPKDWRRQSGLPCACQDCRELSHLLGDPDTQRWEFRAVEARRRHVEGTIRTANCDVGTTTIKQARPHRLVCTKNQASYERRIKQRQQDLVDLGRLTDGKSPRGEAR